MTLTIAIVSGLAVLFVGVLLSELLRRRSRLFEALLPKWVPEAAEGTTPRPSSRRWARALYHNKMISLEELNEFYAAHPANDRDPDRSAAKELLTHMQRGDKVLLRGRFLEVVFHKGSLVQVSPEGGEEFDCFWVKAMDLKPAPCPKKSVFVSTLTSASVPPPALPALTKKSAMSRIVSRPAAEYADFAPWLSTEDYKLYTQTRNTNEDAAIAQYESWSGESLPENCISRKANDTTAGWQKTQQWLLQFPYDDSVAYPFTIVESGCGGGLKLGHPAGILSKRGNTVTVSFVSIIEPLVRAGLRARR